MCGCMGLVALGLWYMRLVFYVLVHGVGCRGVVVHEWCLICWCTGLVAVHLSVFFCGCMGLVVVGLRCMRVVFNVWMDGVCCGGV